MFKIVEPFIENIFIFWANVSYFYVGCVVVSLISVALSWSIEGRREIVFEESEKPKNEGRASLDEDESEDDESKEKMNKKNILENVAQNMSDVDFEQEKEIEKQQLASIFELIQKDREKFQIGSFQELEEQMKLYRE